MSSPCSPENSAAARAEGQLGQTSSLHFLAFCHIPLMIFSMNLMLTNVASSSVSKKLRTGCVGGLESKMVIVHTAHTD